MTFTDAIRSVFTQYAVFSGRARRSEYWYFVLLSFIVGFVINLIFRNSSSMGLVLESLWAVATLVPSLAVGARRLHDTNKSGWLLLIGLVPFVGWIVLIVLMALEGTPGSNQYGASPKAIQGGDAQATLA